MATYYSLIVWGGTSGKALTTPYWSTSTDEITIANHGMVDGTAIRFSGSNIPGGCNSSTTYYVRVTGTSDTVNKAKLCTSWAVAVDTTDTTHFVDLTGSPASGATAKSAYYSTLASTARWTNGGTPCIYDGIQAWATARAATSLPLDSEVIEVWDSFWEDGGSSAATYSLAPTRASTLFTSTVNGARSPAWPFYGGRYTLSNTLSKLRGYVYVGKKNYYNKMILSGTRIAFDGLSFMLSGANDTSAVNLTGIWNVLQGCVLIGDGTYNQFGVLVASTAKVYSLINCIGFGFSGSSAVAYSINAYGSTASVIANNLAVKSNLGFSGDSSGDAGGYWWNNISVGNTTNWSAGKPAAIYAGSGNNYGEKSAGVWTKGTPWYAGSDTGIAISTSAFEDYTNNDFRPKRASAHAADAAATQVDTGLSVSPLLMDPVDLLDASRAAYANGATEVWDGGPFEFDLGYTRPVQRDLVFTGQEDGSQIIVYQTGLTGSSAVELHRNDNTSGDELYPAGAAGVVVDYTILKLGYDPIHVTGVSLDAETTTITVQQTRNRAWVASSGLAYTTDLTFTVGSPNILKARIASPLQNYLCLLYEAFINSATNTALRNIDFPVLTNGPNSFSLVNTEWRGWSTTGTATSNTSLNLLSRDGMRYLASDRTTVNAVWGAFYTPDTPAGMQVKYKQSSGGSPVAALTTGPIDQLIQIYGGGGSYGSFDYTGFMEMRAPKPGYSQPKPDFVATYGALEDQLYPIGLAPTLQYATTDADIDAAHLVLNNGAKTFAVSASHSVAELYQRAQWWANQDAQWSADIPLTSNNGSTFTLATGWTLSGLSYVTGTQTIAGGTCVLDGPGTYAPGFSSNTVRAQGEGTYTFTATDITLEVTPTADNVHYLLGDCTLSGTLTVHNQNAHPIVVEVPAGVTTSSSGNTGGAITFSAPQTYQTVTVSGFVAGSGLQIYDLKYAFTVSGVSITPTAGATYTHNGSTYTVVSTSITAGSGTITVRASVDPQASGTLTKSGGTGDSSITFSAWDFAGTQLFNGTASSGDTVISGSTAVWTDSTPAAAPRVIRLRVSYQSGASAKNFIDTVIGTCATSGSGKDVSYLVSQTDDASYNTSAIDGSAVTGITITTTSGKRVNISLTGGGKRSHQQVYAYQVYWQHTDTGRAQETAFIESYNAAHFTYTDFRFTNPNTGPSNAVTVYNGYGVDAVTGLPETLIADDTPGIVNVVGTESVLITTGSGPLTVGQAADLATAASSAAAAASNATTAATAASAAQTAAEALPTAAEIRAEMDSNSTKLANLDAAVSSRLASGSYTAPDNSGIAAIKAKTDNLPADPASNTQVNTRLASSDYSAPDNSGIAAIKAKTDNLPADPASNTQVNTRLAAADYEAPDNAGIADAAAEAKKARQAGWNRKDLDKTTGIESMKDDDGSSPLATRQVWIDRATGKKYDGTAAPHSVDAFE